MSKKHLPITGQVLFCLSDRQASCATDKIGKLSLWQYFCRNMNIPVLSGYSAKQETNSKLIYKNP